MAAAPQEKPPHSKETCPLTAENEDYSHESDDPVSPYGCGGCFRGLFGWRRHRYLLQSDETRESWVKRKAKKLQEISEVLAGPKWKNLIRRFSMYGMMNKKRRGKTTMQYDIQSYELNFDEGDDGYLGFSARFAAPLAMNKG